MSAVSTPGEHRAAAPPGQPAPQEHRGRGLAGRVTGKVVFLVVLLVVLAAYTGMAAGLEWRTPAGRIGPGFFPRTIGALALAATTVCLVQALRRGTSESQDDVGAEEEAGDGDLGRHPRTMLVMVAASAGLLALFTVLGSIIASALFLATMLFFLNRGRTVTNVLLAVGLPVAVYVLFQSFLNAGLPDGVLPGF